MATVTTGHAGKHFNNSDALCEMLLQVIPSSILVMDHRLRVISANRNFLIKSRRSESETIGKPLKDIIPEAICEQTDILDQIRTVFTEKVPSPGRRMTYRAPGIPSRIYFYRLLPFSGAEGDDSVILLMEDVTEQVRLANEIEKMETHLAGVVESVSDIILSTDSMGRVLSWNRAAEEITGYGKDEVEGTVFTNYLLKDEDGTLTRAMINLFREKSTKMMDWPLVNKSEDHFDVSWVFSPFDMSKDDEIGMVAVGRDLKDIRRLERKLFQSQKFAALGVMAGGIAHQIKNPLAICGSAAQFIMDDGLDPEFRKECAIKIHNAINKASRIIENLLKVSRPTSINDRELVNMQAVITEALEQFENEAKNNNVELVVNMPGDPFFVEGNSELLQQVLVNISLNGIRSMPNGGKLDISVLLENDICIRIKDNGEGIEGAFLDKIFDPFFTTTQKAEGTGLGLSICYSIIDLHSGRIEVESKKNQGSLFSIYLPMVLI